MPSSTSDKEIIKNLERILSKINLYFGLLIFIFGVIGNILNILILSQRSLRSNSCIKIFIAESISGLITLVSGLSFRILSIWDLDVTSDNRWACKLRSFISIVSRSCAYWLIMLATIDRWTVSSPNVRYRQLSTNKKVYRSIFLIILFTMLIHFQIFYCYEIDAPLNPLRCFNKDRTCRLINDLIFSIVTILFPLILILIFGLMTISNIRLSRSRIESTSMNVISRPSYAPAKITRRRNLRRDHSVLIMLFIQVILLAILTIPMSIQRFYSTSTVNSDRSELKRMIDRFIYQVALLMTYVATGMQFYINALSGGYVFRKALIDFFRLMIQKLMCR